MKKVYTLVIDYRLRKSDIEDYIKEQFEETGERISFSDVVEYIIDDIDPKIFLPNYTIRDLLQERNRFVVIDDVKIKEV